MGYINNDRLDMEIRQNTIQEKIRETTWDYHTDLMKLIQNKISPDTKPLNNTEIQRLNEDVINNFGNIVSMQQNMIKLSFDIAKTTLQEAFDKCGFEFDEDGKISTPSTRLEKSNE